MKRPYADEVFGRRSSRSGASAAHAVDHAKASSGAGAGLEEPTPEDTLKVTRILSKHLGEYSLVWQKSILLIANYMQSSRRGFPIMAAWSTPPEVSEFRDALEKVRDLIPGQIAFLKKRTQEPYGTKTIVVAQDSIRLVLDLEKPLNAALSEMPEVRRKPHSQASWHTTARLFASLIERSFKLAGHKAPTRNSARSPLVIAIVELLAESGFPNLGADTVRRALGKKVG